jgi:fibrillarin-like pre-rRNA processing protein
MNQFTPKIAWKNFHGKKKLYSVVSKNNKTEHRIWNPYHSKLAAALFNGLEIFPFKYDSKIFYYEKFRGSTLNHLIDIVESDGMLCTIKNNLDVVNKKTNIVYVESKDFDMSNHIFEEKKFDIIYFDIMNNSDLETQILNYEYILKNSGFLILILNYSNSIEIDTSKKSLENYWDTKSIMEKQEIFKKMGIPLDNNGLQKLNSLKFVELSNVWKDNIALDNNSTMNDFSFKDQIYSILNNDKSSFQLIQEVNLSDFFKNMKLIVMQKTA